MEFQEVEAEAVTEYTVQQCLRRAGIKRGSHNIRDYERGKSAILAHFHPVASGDYEQAIKVLTTWVGI